MPWEFDCIEAFNIFVVGGLASLFFELVSYTGKEHYTGEQLKELFAEWNRIKKEAGVVDHNESI